MQEKSYRLKESQLIDLIANWAQDNGYTNVRGISIVKPEGGSAVATFVGCHKKDQVVAETTTVDLAERTFGVSDTIRLEGRTDKGRSYVKRYGEWWKAPAFMNTKEAVITNLPKKKQGKYAGTLNEITNVKLRRTGDPDFKVIHVIKFPEQFNPKTYKE